LLLATNLGLVFACMVCLDAGVTVGTGACSSVYLALLCATVLRRTYLGVVRSLIGFFGALSLTRRGERIARRASVDGVLSTLKQLRIFSAGHLRILNATARQRAPVDLRESGQT
jgi:hypothetical protein